MKLGFQRKECVNEAERVPKLSQYEFPSATGKEKTTSFIQQCEENDAADGNIYRGYC